MSLLRRATTKVTVRRASLTGGKKDQSAAAAVLTDLACTVPTPLDTSQGNPLTQDPTVKSIFALYVAFVIGLQDIRQGDICDIDGIFYTVKGASRWPQGRTAFTQVSMERINP